MASLGTLPPLPSGRWTGNRAPPTGGEDNGSNVHEDRSAPPNAAEPRAGPFPLPDEDTLFRDAFHYAPIGMAVVGGRGEIRLSNRSFQRMLGYTEEELEQITFLEVTHPDDQESCATAVEKMQGGGGRLYFPQKRYVRKDGTWLWATVHGSFRLDDEGHPVYGLIQVQDISARVHGEAEVTRSHARLEHAQRIAQVGSWEVEFATDEVTWSAELYRIYGLSPTSFHPTYETYLDRIHVDDRTRIREQVKAIRDRQWDDSRPLVLQHRIVRPDGSVRDITTEGHLERDDKGRAVRLVGTSQDVTAREAAQRALEKQVRQEDAVAALGREALQNEDIAAVLQLGVERAATMLDADFGRLAEILPGGESVIVRASVGWPTGDEAPLVHDIAADAQTAEALQEQRAVILENVAEDTSLATPFMPPGHDAVSGMTVPVIGPHGPIGVLSVHSRAPRLYSTDDIRFLQSIGVLLATAIERKQTEKALVQREQQLFAAQKMEAIARLAGGVAHDFNNLLLVISGFAGLLQRQLRDDDPRLREVNAISQAADRASKLTRQLLAFGRKQVLQPQPLDINEVVKDIRRMLSRMLGEDITIEVDLASELACVEADPGQLEQVLLNLAVNARDAMPDGGRIRFSTRNIEIDEDMASTFDGLEPGNHVLLSIEDNGVGMDVATQSQVFEPFFSTKERDKGSGLGLSTVYGIVKQSGGDITLRSRVGRGTRIDVYLPWALEGIPATEPDPTPTVVPGGVETLLVVEDEDAVRSLAVRILAEYGYTVLDAANGKEALQTLREASTPVDMLVTDVVMPGMGGPELAQKTRRMLPDMPVLFVSGYADQRDRMRDALEHDAAFLRKPFSPADLARAVRTLLDR